MPRISKADPKTFLSSLPTQPGVYEILDETGNVLYVGKARNLKKRVTSYFHRKIVDAKILALMEQAQDIKVTITHSENEALLLENNIIKKLKPRYNILLRDDKTYPYLYLSAHAEFPRIDIYRGAKTLKGQYFGPYPSAGSVRETLTLLQKLFKIRQCTDHFFNLRTRPCLQYYIRRCTAPCVGYVDVPTYQRNVKLAVLFLEGKNNQVIEELAVQMEAASTNMDYETAARYRDQIVSLRRIQERQYVVGDVGDIDVIALVQQHGQICLLVLYIRGGRLIGNKSYFPKVPEGSSAEEALAAFIPQYYLDPARGEAIPKCIIINLKLEEQHWIESALSEQLQQKIVIVDEVRGQQRQWLNLAITNAQHTLQLHLVGKINFYQKLEELQTELQLPNMPQRIECYDVSHTMGEATVASCVVFDTEGPVKKDYRRFNIKNITKGDDYAALTQVLTRRYTRLKEGEAPLPDILMIDGGKGQLSIAEAMLEELQVSGVTLLAIAKGAERRPGLETLFLSGRDTPIHLSPDSMALHLLQQIRDEAHRFAIVGHRKLRAKTHTQSPLENIPGIGPRRRRELLRQFGGLQELKRASVDDLAAIPGISRELAQRIFDFLQSK